MIDFFEFSNEMLCQANHQGWFTRVNPAWTKTLGWSAEELTSRPYLDFVHPEDKAATLKEAELLASGNHETIRFENRYRHRDGSYRWLAWRVMVPPGSDEHVASARDITDWKTAESKLRESEERFRAFMDNMSAIAWAKDEQGRLVYLNKAVERKFGIRPEDWLGKSVFELMPAEVAQPIWEHDQEVLATTKPLRVIEQTVSDEHDASFWLADKFLFFDRHGSRYVGGCGVDITELKQVENSLLAERDIMRNLIGVQEKERQFLCNEFHDGLIQYAVGSLMALESLRDSAPALADEPVIKAVIENLRLGIEDGRQAIRGIRPAVLDDSGVDEAIEDLASQFSKGGFQVTTVCDQEIGRLPEDIQATVYRVVQESLNNAKKYSGTNAARIEMRKMNEELQLEVSDLGCGFDQSRAVKQGFGLQGMIQRVQLAGGHSRIESKPGDGTRISVRLPLPAAATGRQSG